MRGGTSFVTTAPAPTNASSPISTAGQSTAPPPTRAPRRIVGPSISVVPPLGAAHEVVVRRDDAGRDEDVLLERRVGGDVGARLDLVIAPIVVSFSTSEPRPRTTSSPIVHALADAGLVAEDHARADRRAGEDDRARRDDVPSPISAGGSGSRFAVERGESVGCFPTTAPSSTFTPSPSTVPG